jgi:hypothetical protein
VIFPSPCKWLDCMDRLSAMNGRRPVATRVAGKGPGVGRGGGARKVPHRTAPNSFFFSLVGWFPIQTSWVLPQHSKETNEVPSVVVRWCCFSSFPRASVAASHARVPLARNPPFGGHRICSEFEFVWRMNVTVFPRTWRRRPDPAPTGEAERSPTAPPRAPCFVLAPILP